MIAKVADKRKDGKSSFNDLVIYIEGGGDEEKSLYTNFRGFEVEPKNTNELIKEMISTASFKDSRAGDPVFHGVLSWREGETPTKEQVEDAVSIYLKEMGLENCQCYYGLHQNTDNMHLHICVNRIDPVTHQAILPSNGLWKKADERASRRIELSQGWKIEESGAHYEVIDGEIYEKTTKRRVPALSTKAKDFENRTSGKSAERLAQERCASVLFNAGTWDEVHRKLAQIGCRLERKGSGGVIFVGDIPVKMSKVSQSLSFSKMEKRLGIFVASDFKTEDERTIRSAEPVRYTLNSEQHLKERAVYYAEKIQASKDLKNTFERERNQLKEKQYAERQKIQKSVPSWKGHRKELNAIRSLLAWEQVQERDAWKESKKIRRRRLSHEFKQSFPSYEEWLKLNEKNKTARLWRYRESVPGIIGGDGIQEIIQNAAPNLMSMYETSVAEEWNDRRQGALLYFKAKANKREVAFADVGKRIDIKDWRNEETILDALKLASQKWTSVALHGSDAYKEICVRTAVRNGITITNPELQELIHVEKVAYDAETKNKYSWGTRMRELNKNFETYHNAVGAKRYRVMAITMDENGNNKGEPYILDKEPGMKSRGFTPDEVVGQLEKIKALEDKGKNLYLTPISDDVHHILIDDIKGEEKLKELINDGYQPALILRSSENNYQAILNVPKIDSEFDSAIGNKLMRDLNQKYGDPNICGSIHAHRMPGTHNFKPKHRQSDGTFPEVKIIVSAEKRTCQKALNDSKGIALELKKNAERIKDTPAKKNTYIGELKTIPPYDAYMIHAKDIIARYDSVDYSRVDSMVSVRMYITGYSESERAEAIAVGSRAIRPEDMKNKHKWVEYGLKSARYPDTPSGHSEVLKNEEKRNIWLWLEGRQTEKNKGIKR